MACVANWGQEMVTGAISVVAVTFDAFAIAMPHQDSKVQADLVEYYFSNWRYPQGRDGYNTKAHH